MSAMLADNLTVSETKRLEKVGAAIEELLDEIR